MADPRFQVPQFIEVEDKIFGPLTLKQFIYVVGGAGLSVILYLFLPWYLAFLLIAPVLAFSGALAFYKINNKPFIFVVEAAVKYFFNTKLYIWRKEEQPVMAAEESVEVPEENVSAYLPKLSDSKLRELTWSLDIKDAHNPVTKKDKTI